MLNQVMLWQAMIVGWARERMSNKDDAGASLVEYALLLALIAVVAIGPSTSWVALSATRLTMSPTTS